MRILYLNSPVYDFLTATLIEGLLQLREEYDLQLVATERANYAPRSTVWTPERILKEADRFDWIILGTNEGVNSNLFRLLEHLDRSVCVDGADESTMSLPPEDFRFYFKRELPIEAVSPANVFPCPFAVERRWLLEQGQPRSIFFSAAFGPSTDQRREMLEFLRSIEDPSFHLGPVAGSRWMGIDGVWRGQCSWREYRRHPFAVGHNRAYHALLRQSELSLSMPGEGWDTGRFWEILGAGAGLLSPAPRIQIPNPLIADRHFLSYDDSESLSKALSHARLDRQGIAAMRERAHRHILAHHTSKERARYVLDTLARRHTPTIQATLP